MRVLIAIGEFLGMVGFCLFAGLMGVMIGLFFASVVSGCIDGIGGHHEQPCRPAEARSAVLA